MYLIAHQVTDEFLSVKNDLSAHNLFDVNPLDRESWRRKIKDSLVLPTPDAGTTAAP